MERVSAEYFALLGVRPALGRTFSPAEDAPGAPGAAVIGDALWRGVFGADPAVLGRPVLLDNVPFRIVGVMPPGFAGLSFDTEIWAPPGPFETAESLLARDSRWLGTLTRLRPGVSVEAAQGDLDAAAAELTRLYPDTNRERGAQLAALREGYVQGVRNALLAAFGGSAPAAAARLRLRTAGAAALLAEPLRRLAMRVDPNLALYRLEPLVETVAAQSALGTFLAALLSAFGALALVLAALGLYGVLAFAVRGRRRELAIRGVVGATPHQLGALVLGQAMAMVLAGLAVGSVASVFSGRLLVTFLYATRAAEPPVLLAAAGLLAGAAAVAGWLPAATPRRPSRGGRSPTRR